MNFVIRRDYTKQEVTKQADVTPKPTKAKAEKKPAKASTKTNTKADKA